ncbi:MAG TPA: UDP-2,3-diacylglucosamine diphosphatase [Bacteroidales bacterium]|nr:UDP-2,3-diacylglucosamine diphosphatase [Bacteroidales bacterium]
MAAGKNIYFISDLHLGLYPPERSTKRERILVDWLDSIKNDASELYMLGDIFDFWHEYRHVVPRGFVRFLGKLAELSDSGVQLHFFTGNHDIWVYDYLPAELGLKVYRESITRTINGKRFFLSHGDGVGPWETGYKLMKWAFTNRLLQWFFARIHPNASMAFGKRWSKSSRYAKGIIAEDFKGEDKEYQIMFARSAIARDHYDYFVFGHRHIPYDIRIAENSRVINLGDWITNFTYAVWDGTDVTLKSVFPENEQRILRK